MMLTEQSNPKTANIDRLSTIDIINLINEEDRTVANAVQAALPHIAQAVEGIVERLKRGGRLIYTGAGTSGRLGVLDAVESVPTFSSPPELIQGVIAGGNRALTHAVEGAEDDREAGVNDLKALHLKAEDVVVGIAASGRTPYVLSAVAYAESIGALTIGVACNAPAPLLEAVQISIGVPVGPEVIAGSTRMKAGTAQKMVLNMLSTATMIRMGKVYGNLMVDLQVTNEKLAERGRQIVMHLTGLEYAAAFELLQQAHNRVKIAVVMHHRNADYDTAIQILTDNDGFLRRIIEK